MSVLFSELPPTVPDILQCLNNYVLNELRKKFLKGWKVTFLRKLLPSACLPTRKHSQFYKVYSEFCLF